VIENDKRPCISRRRFGRIVRHSYKAQIDPAAPATSQLAGYAVRGDHETAGAGRLRFPQREFLGTMPRPVQPSQIKGAATALVMNATLVSRDSDFHAIEELAPVEP
jgi:predicted nucleic acid-binding protein